MSNKPVRRDELSEVFRTFESAPENFRIGAESEKFGVHERTGKPLGYGGSFSVCQVFEYLEKEHGWSPIREVDDGPVIALRRRGSNITLEPGAQLELSGEPLADLHQVADEQNEHLRELAPISKDLHIAWLTTGFHPLASLAELPWVPKQRYPIMRSYLPLKGPAALDMMQRTATIQGNFDWSSERDGMRKLVLALKLSPLVHAWFANAPFKEGSPAGTQSGRGHVWRGMDPSRSGLIRPLWEKKEPSYDDYVQWSLDSGMFLFKRGGQFVKNTGQTFGDFLEHGFDGYQATLDDYRLHLTTLFPEVRLKNTLEVRSCDGLPPSLALAALAVWTGVLYDGSALDQAEELVSTFRHDQMEKERPRIIDEGLAAPLAGRPGFDWAERLLTISRGGLSRRGRQNERGEDETIYLKPAAEILESRLSPAQRARERYEASGSMIDATRIAFEG